MKFTISKDLIEEIAAYNVKEFIEKLWRFIWAMFFLDLMIVLYKTVSDYIIRYVSYGVHVYISIFYSFIAGYKQHWIEYTSLLFGLIPIIIQIYTLKKEK